MVPNTAHLGSTFNAANNSASSQPSLMTNDYGSHAYFYYENKVINVCLCLGRFTGDLQSTANAWHGA